MDTTSGRGHFLLSQLPGRFRREVLVAVAASLVGLSAAWSQVPPPTQRVMPENGAPATPSDPSAGDRLAAAVSPSDEDQSAGDRLREGTELKDVRGYFRIMEDRVVFSRTGGDARYIGLENLNLERIVTEITNNPAQLEWTIVGTITEYRGTNYLMVRRAILSKSTSESAAPPLSAPVAGPPSTPAPPKPIPGTLEKQPTP